MGSTGGAEEKEHVGFVSAQAKALYLEVIATGGSVELSEADISGTYRELIELGLLVVVHEKPLTLTATDPTRLAGRLGSVWQKQALALLSQAVSIPLALQDLSHAYQGLEQTNHPDGPIVHAHGVPEINQRLGTLFDGAEWEVLTAQPGGSRREHFVQEVMERDLGLARRGVARRVIYHPSARYSAPTRQYVEAMTEAGSEVRTLEEPFTRIFIIDRRVAVIPTPGDGARAAFISDTAVVAYLFDLFERMWARSSPFLGAAEVPPEVISRMRANILRLMVQGVGHRVIARNLGISERTLARHIAEFREEYGSETLFQLGWRMALHAPNSLYNEDGEVSPAVSPAQEAGQPGQ
ncbi:helix-turn-helix domain-containing protein [Kitasatospora viridis]|uniref:Sugar-specific transcriptional regulator TrmB n=1 Tax=Kitasatospora viridis TaxID=281105 RepID=A0A561UHS0_9ACTN|nr:helix-turn-helix domain-containing protein [Kitasatospora viridis]TWF98906.1 sugar-specific transcriptional regulator TrmB [Kitasatospora viridis]